MEFLIVLGIICTILGLIGTFAPGLPGVPLSYAGLILLQLSNKVQFSIAFLIFWGVVTIAVSILDYYIPIWGTKKFGGSKYGIWGCFIGTIVGLFFGPLGIIFGPFVGAVLGELLAGKNTKFALKAGFGSFIGFLAGNILRFTTAGFMLFYAVKAII